MNLEKLKKSPSDLVLLIAAALGVIILLGTNYINFYHMGASRNGPTSIGSILGLSLHLWICYTSFRVDIILFEKARRQSGNHRILHEPNTNRSWNL